MLFKSTICSARRGLRDGAGQSSRSSLFGGVKVTKNVPFSLLIGGNHITVTPGVTHA